MRIRWSLGFILAMTVPIAVVSAILYGFFGRMNLINHHDLAVGEVYGYTRGVKGGPNACTVKYRYTAEGKAYERTTLFRPPVLTCEDCQARLVGRTFPIVYEKGHAGNSTILLSPSAFRIYSYSFPDSLKWVQEFVHEK